MSMPLDTYKLEVYLDGNDQETLPDPLTWKADPEDRDAIRALEIINEFPQTKENFSLYKFVAYLDGSVYGWVASLGKQGQFSRFFAAKEWATQLGTIVRHSPFTTDEWVSEVPKVLNRE